jgi:hypothetical protein
MSSSWYKGLTLRKDVHRIVYLDIHVVTDSRQLVLLGTDNSPILSPDLPCRRPLLGKLTRNNNGFAVLLRFVRLFTLVLE